MNLIKNIKNIFFYFEIIISNKEIMSKIKYIDVYSKFLKIKKIDVIDYIINYCKNRIILI